MSLRVEDWKRVLDQPKNLGMKAGGGTGISEALRKVREASNRFEEHKAEPTAEAVVAALQALERQCDGVIGKHQKLFTSACEYLKTVKASAAAAIQEWERKFARAHKYADTKHRAEELRAQMKATCASYLNKIESARNLETLRTLWSEFLQQFGHEFEAYRLNPAAHDPDLVIAFEQARMYKPKEGQLETIQPQYTQKAKAVEHTLQHLPPLKPWGWDI